MVDEDGQDYRVPVPYCKKKDKRIVIKGGLLCEGCKDDKEGMDKQQS